MDNGLHLQLGEMEVGKVKTSLVVDENLWKDFSITVIQNKGNRKKNDVIIELIKDYIKKNGGK